MWAVFQSVMHPPQWVEISLEHEDVYQQIQGPVPCPTSRCSLVEGNVLTWTCWSPWNYGKLQSGEGHMEWVGKGVT